MLAWSGGRRHYSLNQQDIYRQEERHTATQTEAMSVINIGPDPSLAYRPNLEKNATKEKEDYRNFESGSLIDRVFKTYNLMHTNQTLEFVKQKHSEWSGCNHTQMTMMDAIMSLDQLVDESDPDVDFPNSFHAFQTAEGIRQAHPDKDWFQLVGLIHDVGKMMALWDEPQTLLIPYGFELLQPLKYWFHWVSNPGPSACKADVITSTLWNHIQWAVVGDTFPVGCKFQNSIVFRDNTFLDNPDDKNPSYNTEYGIYESNCGLDKVFMSWGHDEYLYRVMKFNNSSIPEEGLYMIRFHSFYPWHSHDDYMHLCNDKDLRMLPWVREFNKFDLYTKTSELPDVDKLKPYYQSLIDKYCPGILKW